MIINLNHWPAEERDDVCRLPDVAYVGRGSPFGSPFVIGQPPAWTRERAVEMYQVYFTRKVAEDTDFRRRVDDLRGKRLACWCVDRDGHGMCHARTLLAYLRAEEETSP